MLCLYINVCVLIFQLHIVHFNERYPSLSEAADKSDGLAVLGLFFVVSLL